MAVPGETPKLPVITLEPVLVTAEAPRTAKLSAVKRFTVDCKAETFGGVEKMKASNNARNLTFFKVIYQTVTICSIVLLFITLVNGVG